MPKVKNPKKTATPFEDLVKIMDILRSPGGCPWDREQSHRTMKKYVMEEAREVVGAIEEEDPIHLCEELGDLLMIILFHARIAKEAGTFTIDEVVDGISKKLVNRHPHVFSAREGLSPAGVVARWNVLKTEEKQQKKRISNRMEETLKFNSPLQSALKVQEEAAEVGFDFPTVEPAIEKIREEAEEILDARNKFQRKHLESEIGDLMFAVINVSRLLGFDPEKALRTSVSKFVKRFARVEKHFEKSGGMAGKTIEELDAVWEKLKIRR